MTYATDNTGREGLHGNGKDVQSAIVLANLHHKHSGN